MQDTAVAVPPCATAQPSEPRAPRDGNRKHHHHHHKHHHKSASASASDDGERTPPRHDAEPLLPARSAHASVIFESPVAPPADECHRHSRGPGSSPGRPKKHKKASGLEKLGGELSKDAGWHGALGAAISFLGGCVGTRVRPGVEIAPAPAAAPCAAQSGPPADACQEFPGCSALKQSQCDDCAGEGAGDACSPGEAFKAAAAASAEACCGSGSGGSSGGSGGTEASESYGYEEEDSEEYDAMEESVMAALEGEPADDSISSRRNVLTASDIVREQQKVVAAVAEVLSVDQSVAAAMLRRYRWRKDALLSAFVESPEKFFKEVGAAPKDIQGEASVAPVKAAGPVMCTVCGETVGPESACALQCKHWFCTDCWVSYLTLKINEGQSCFITCPAHKCSLIVDQELVERIVPKELYAKYVAFITKSFVDDNPDVKWCPAPGCGNALKADQCIKGIGYCTCGYRFCWECGEEAHMPATCAEVLSWKKKCLDDSETVHWIMTNTQSCPKCKSSIEKNGGCNHMTCRKCKHEFCWVCHGDWKGHTNFYSCNRYETEAKKEKKKVKKSQKEKAQQLNESKAALEKYLHYYHRYANHERSSKFEAQQREQSLRRMRELRETDSQYQDVSFIMEATETLLECRKALKNSYIHAYYLPEGTARNLFELQQSDLESITEHLSEMLEQPIDKLNRSEVKHVASLCSLRLSNMIEEIDHHCSVPPSAP
eukprot:m51a1_g2407 putative ubiquitin-protein ligase (716) ;mRNA; f:774107-776751